MSTRGRLVPFVLAGLSLVYLLQARSFETGFIADPIGPKAFPYGIGILGIVCSLFLLRESKTPAGEPLERPFLVRALLLTVSLLVYAFVLETIGFVLATTLLMTAFVGLFRGKLLPGLGLGFLLSVLFFAVFTYGLAVPLPFGTIFGGR